MKYCKYCGNKLDENMDVCLSCGKLVNDKNESKSSNARVDGTPALKSKIAAGLLGIFLGAFGVHNYYLGYNGKATAQLLLTILSCGILSFISGTWGLIEGILILTGTIDTDAYGNKLGE